VAFNREMRALLVGRTKVKTEGNGDNGIKEEGSSQGKCQKVANRWWNTGIQGLG
jgi:hypothetical protein